MYETLLKESAIIAPILAAIMATGASFLATLHLLLYRSDERASLGWLGLIWISPVIGVLVYVIFGVSRLQRRVKKLRQRLRHKQSNYTHYQDSDDSLPNPSLEQLVHVGRRATGWPLLGGNVIEPLLHGDQTYPAMIEAIEGASHSITMVSYIFDNDSWGKRIAKALHQAQERGVEVRVLVDAAGSHYTFPTIIHELKRLGIPCARFLPATLRHPFRLVNLNLRNHRKIMVVDGTIGFTGGINIRAACVLADAAKKPVRDLHFRLQGPIVSQLQVIFQEDWLFSCGEDLQGDLWLPTLDDVGTTYARGIPDGPDEDIHRLRWVIMGALSCAKKHVRIVTPYFIPDEAIRQALVTAQMRGVTVEVILPQENNLAYMHWGAMSKLGPLLEQGVKVFFSPGDFDHSKLMVVDQEWCLVGSGNWDSRSFRLNFEFNVEIYDQELAKKLLEITQDRVALSEQMTIEQWESRVLLVKLRDALVGLGAPYL